MNCRSGFEIQVWALFFSLIMDRAQLDPVGMSIKSLWSISGHFSFFLKPGSQICSALWLGKGETKMRICPLQIFTYSLVPPPIKIVSSSSFQMVYGFMTKTVIVRLLWPRKVSSKRFSVSMSWNCNIFTGTNTFWQAGFKSEKFPLRAPAVFSQTAMLFYLNLFRTKFFRCLATWVDENTRLHNPKRLVPLNQSLWKPNRFTATFIHRKWFLVATRVF